MSAVQAIETIFGTEISPWIRDMRRVFYCGEWLQSHSLHIHLLAAPDFLGYDSAPQLARDHADAVRRGLHLHAGVGVHAPDAVLFEPLVKRATEFLEDEMAAGHLRRSDPRLVLVSAYSTVMGVATEVEVLRAVGIEPTLREAVRRRRELLRFLHAALYVES